MIEICVLDIKLTKGDRPLKAYVDIQIDDWIIRDFRIVKQNGQRAWVSPPQITWQDQTGQTHYRSVLDVPPELKQRIDVAVLAAWEKEISNGQARSE